MESAGQSGSGSRGGGGAGGSVILDTPVLSGLGKITVRGGNVIKDGTDCPGGGGGGGRTTIYYKNSSFSGTIVSHGGLGGFECGAAGTVLWRQVQGDFDDTNRVYKDMLIIDNMHGCVPLQPKINYGKLTDQHRGEVSCKTWLYDPDNIHTHNFSDITISGDAMVALHRINTDTFEQKVIIETTGGDKSGTFQLGQYQTLITKLPEHLPELQFGILINPRGVLQTAKQLLVNSITIDNEGTVAGMENMIIGPGGVVYIRFVINIEDYK